MKLLLFKLFDIITNKTFYRTFYLALFICLYFKEQSIYLLVILILYVVSLVFSYLSKYIRDKK